MKVEYVIIKDGTQEVFRAKTWNDCIDYLRRVKDIYEESYRVVLNETDGSLSLQDYYTHDFILSMLIRIDDGSGSLNLHIADNLFNRR